MLWNWQHPDWPNFRYDPKCLEPAERTFLLRSGELIGAFRHIGSDDEATLRIEVIGEEAVRTSEIEGELLDRESVQSSLRHQFGLGQEQPGVKPAERGISRMMVDLYRRYATPLSQKTLFDWHRMLLSGNRSIRVIGGYRAHSDPMQIVSGADHRRTVHFEAPPSARASVEMDRFIAWFNETAPSAKNPLPALTRAGIAHLYFESIHPFEDGNGRIGRALVEKSLAQSLGQPTLIALAYTIERKRKAYYAALERNSRGIEITDWLAYFAATLLEAQSNTITRVSFYIAKTRFYDRLRGQLNQRQERVIARMLREGVDGFQGGLSAENYITIGKTSRATATRDLQDLVAKGALTRTGERRHTRYWLALDV